MQQRSTSILIWNTTTIYDLMKSIDFLYADELSHHEHPKHRGDVIAIRDNYLGWVDRYRADGY